MRRASVLGAPPRTAPRGPAGGLSRETICPEKKGRLAEKRKTQLKTTIPMGAKLKTPCHITTKVSPGISKTAAKMWGGWGWVGGLCVHPMGFLYI